MNLLTQPKSKQATSELADKFTRLSVNLNFEAAAALKDLTKRRGITITEGIRRAIAVWKFVEDAKDKGQKIQVFDPETKTTRELVLLS